MHRKSPLDLDTYPLVSSRRMSQVAVIPARGGSKRIPGKNIRIFHGQPIIAYSISAAQESCLFERIIVSTDSEEIADVARDHGAEVPFLRSSENANDTATMATAVLETLQTMATAGQLFERVCCLFATAPFLSADLISLGHKLMNDGNCDSVIVVKRNSQPIMRTLQTNQSGHLRMVWEEYLRTRSQDLTSTCHDAAQMYWANLDALINQRTFYTNKAAALYIDELASHDIDTPEDWTIAEKLWTFQQMQVRST